MLNSLDQLVTSLRQQLVKEQILGIIQVNLLLLGLYLLSMLFFKGLFFLKQPSFVRQQVPFRLQPPKLSTGWK